MSRPARAGAPLEAEVNHNAKRFKGKSFVDFDQQQREEEEKEKELAEKARAAEAPEESVDDDDAKLAQLLGLTGEGFGSTKGKQSMDNVRGPSKGACAPKAKKARQYMNRKGGFNRSLGDR